MPLAPQLRTRLLGAIESDSLVFLCGAGLSMAAPSLLPSAVAIANECYDDWSPIEVLDPAFRNDIDAIAEHFHAKAEFETIFVNRLVPWNRLAGAPNAGHAAIADFLISRGAFAALSSNFDPLIENWAIGKKIAMRGALDGREAGNFHGTSNPLIKFHGCMQRNREETIWTKAQLTDPSVQSRIDTCSQWMNLNMPGKHIVVIGFWSDWGYLNDVLAGALTLRNAASVTVVNPGTQGNLETKAPLLWQTFTQLSQHFEHIPVSGDVFLEELRTAYSEVWISKFLAKGKKQIALQNLEPTPLALAATPLPVNQPLTGEDMYDLRRDAEGLPYTCAAQQKGPPGSSTQAAIVRLKLLDAGATRDLSWLNLRGTIIRVVNGGGKTLEEVQGDYREPPSFRQPHVTICAGAEDMGVPEKIIRDGERDSIVRPAAGTGSQWMTTGQAEEAQIL